MGIIVIFQLSNWISEVKLPAQLTHRTQSSYSPHSYYITYATWYIPYLLIFYVISLVLCEFRCSYREIWQRYVYMPLQYISTIFHRYYSSYHHLFPCGDCVTDSFTLRRYPQFSNFQWKSQYVKCTYRV